MELTNLLIRFLTFSLEMIVAGLMLIKHRLTFRYKWYIAIPIGLIIALSGAAIDIFALYVTNQWNEFIKIAVYAVATATIFAGFLFAYKIKVPHLLLLLSVAYTFQHMAYQWGVIFLDTGLGALMKENMYITYYNIVYNVILYAVKIGVYIVCYFFVARFYIKYSKYILGTVNIIVLGAMMFLVANVVNVYISERLQSDYTMRGILAAAIIMFCVIFDTLVVGGFRVMEHRQETTIIKATLNSKVRQQEMMENNINFINMKCHDLRKELRRLKEHKGELKDEDFCMLEESLNFYDSSIKTGNVNIDALIQDKLIYCNSVGIEFTALVDGDAFKDMASSDIYFLLVNIIDNAIEASEAFDEKERRVISLTASKKHGVLLIEETNYYKGQVSINSDGSIKTTKEDKKYHGFGTKSIAYIVKKYDGKMEYEIKDNIFKLKIAI